MPDWHLCDPGKKGQPDGRCGSFTGIIWGPVLAYFFKRDDVCALFIPGGNRTVLRAYFTGILINFTVRFLPTTRSPSGHNGAGKCPGTLSLIRRGGVSSGAAALLARWGAWRRIAPIILIPITGHGRSDPGIFKNVQVPSLRIPENGRVGYLRFSKKFRFRA
jgi:hypothetical protein